MCWTGREAHGRYDVCADDHCQRYQGIGRVNTTAQQAVQETRGEVLLSENEICDTRYSKCCGGITENFSTAWEDKDVAYLASINDSWLPVSVQPGEDYVRSYILARPEVYCKVTDKNLLKRMLPDFDYETKDFFRWTVDISQSELGHILHAKTGIDFGLIKDIVPLARGASGRLYKIKLCGTRQEKIIGKELEIRRILAPAHLLSSAFVVDPYGMAGKIPNRFRIRGAGWGHGVGLCQIGAAAMAERGNTYQQILLHYFKSAQLARLYQ
jgi:SpoIID/LytB domain protein